MTKIKLLFSILLLITVSLSATAKDNVLYQYSYKGKRNLDFSYKTEKQWPFSEQDAKDMGEEVVKKGIEFCKTDESVLYIEKRFNHYIKNHPGTMELNHWANVYVDKKVCAETPTLLTCKAHAVSCHPIITSKNKQYYITEVQEPVVFRGLNFKKKCEALKTQALEDSSVMSAEVEIGADPFKCGVNIVKIENR